MKKRLLSALLALALVFVLLPTTALAGVTTGKEDYDISINGKGWKFDKEDNSDAYIPVYFYGNDPSRYFFSTEANDNWATNSNLKLTKEGNTVTITIRPKKNHIHGNKIEFTLEKISTTSGRPYDFTPCIEMGNGNNLVITGKGTLNITRDERNGIGAALYSKVGDITITDGITVKANFLKQVSFGTVGNAISVENHDLIISGKNTKVEAKNSSCNSQDSYDVSATVCVENGEIKVSDGATLNAANSYTNPTGPTDPANPRYSYYSRAISGSSSKPCALTVTGENSCVIAETDNSLGKAYGHVNFSIDGAKIEVGTSSPAQTITDINDISNYKYAKISVPALETTSDVSIAGGNAVVGQWTTITANSCSGSYYYDAAKKELTLKDVNIASSSIINAIQFAAAGTYTVKLEGTNEMSGVSKGILAANVAKDAINVIISGSGSLDISAKGRAIEVSGNLTFNNTGTINLKTTNTANNEINAINASGKISIGSDFNKNLRITADNGDMTFDPTIPYTDYNDLKNYKSISFSLKDSTISYDGTTLKQGQTINGENGGKATVSTDGYTITLDNFKGDKALVFNAEITPNSITLIGDSTLSAVETKYQSLTISGSGSLTVGSIRVPNNTTTSNSPNLTIDGATVIAGTNTSTTRAIEVKGDLTVKNNATLTATSKSDSVPTVQVGGNASFTGRTATITNHSTTQGERYKDSYEVSSALHVDGDITISGGTVTAEAKAGGDAIRAVGNITVSNGATVIAQNNSQYFSAITAGRATSGEVNTLYKLIVSGESTSITATNTHINNLTYGGAINAYIENANEGHYLKANTDSKAIAPNDSATVKSNSLTITRGDAYVAPTKTITEIIVTGLTPPVKGATPVDKSNVTLTEGMTVESITWGPDLTSDGKFAADTSYTAHIKYSVNAGYELAANANCPQVAGADVTRWLPQDEIEVTFPKTAADSTHEHNWDEAWHDLGNGYHAHKCTGCDVYDTATQESHNVTGYRDNYDGSHSKICGSCGYSAKVSHSYTWAPNVNDNEKHIGTCVCGNVVEKYHNFVGDVCQECGYDKSTGTTCEHVWTTEWTIDTVDNEYHWHKCIKCGAIADKEAHAYTIVTDNGTNHTRECECKVFYVEDHISSDWIIDTPATATTAGSKHKECTVCKHEMQTEVIPATGEIVPPTPDNPGTIVIIRPAEEEKPAQQPNPSTGANDLVGLAVAAAVAAALGSAALLRKHD